MQRGKPRFNMVGQSLPSYLSVTGEKISDGLVTRLHRYAKKIMDDHGFNIDNCSCEVSTMDASCKPSDREYCVDFINAKGGVIGVQGILTNHGHPSLYHRLFIHENA
jgi:hypothetical protein